MNLVKRLELYRLKNRVSQQKIAETLDVAFSTVNRWFNGKSKPNQIQVFHIEKLLKKGK